MIDAEASSTKKIESTRDIMLAAQLASCLELSASPKAGCVDRFDDHPRTTFQHYLAGGIALGLKLEHAAVQAYELKKKGQPLKWIQVGRWIKTCAASVGRVQGAGNTHLGTILLYTPLACAAASLLAGKGLDEKGLRLTVGELMAATTVQDSIDVYEAIRASDAGGLGRISSSHVPDIHNPDYVALLRRRNLSLFRIMDAAKGWDSVASELSSSMEIGFSIGKPRLVKLVDGGYDLNTAMVHTFLTIMARIPDTLIIRKLQYQHGKSGKEAARISSQYSLQAQEALDCGGLETEMGIRRISKLDRDLRSRRLSPGTTADLLSESIFIALLTRGYPMIP